MNDVKLNKYGNNEKIKAYILDESEMRKIGFTDCREDTWFYEKIIDLKMDISFSVSINKNDPLDFRIYILDEDFLQPYDYQYLLKENPNFKPALKIKELVEEQIKYLQNAGILSGHIYGEYI